MQYDCAQCDCTLAVRADDLGRVTPWAGRRVQTMHIGSLHQCIFTGIATTAVFFFLTKYIVFYVWRICNCNGYNLDTLLYFTLLWFAFGITVKACIVSVLCAPWSLCARLWSSSLSLVQNTLSWPSTWGMCAFNVLLSNAMQYVICTLCCTVYIATTCGHIKSPVMCHSWHRISPQIQLTLLLPCVFTIHSF